MKNDNCTIFFRSSTNLNDLLVTGTNVLSEAWGDLNELKMVAHLYSELVGIA